jgi:hypothetical protein
MNVDAFDNFNAGTIMGYRGDNWESIKTYSGLWKSDGRLHNTAVWHKKLPGIETKRRDYNSSLQLNESLWFNFSVKRESAQRVTRGTLPLPSISEISSNCTPGDETAIQMIDDFHGHVRRYGRSYAPRFSPALLDALRTLKKAEDFSFEDAEVEVSEDEVAEECSDSDSEAETDFECSAQPESGFEKSSELNTLFFRYCLMI